MTDTANTGTTSTDATAGGCSCCAGTEATAASTPSAEETTGMTTTTYTVAGMTCGHCVNAVSTEIGDLPGVIGTEVDLPSGAVTVTSATPLAESEVAAAVDEAGYELTSAGADAGRIG